jgi:hypothetical protein
MDEKAIVGVVVPETKTPDDPAQRRETAAARVLLIIRDDVGKYVPALR